MAYYSGTHIVSELMLVKDDRKVDARDYLSNKDDDKHRRHVGRGALLGSPPPRGRRLLHGISRSHPFSLGAEILLKDALQTDCTCTSNLHFVIY